MPKFSTLKSLLIIAITLAAALIAALYFGGNTVKPKTKSETPDAEQETAVTPGQMQAAAMNLPKPANFDSLLSAAKMKLSPATQSAIAQQENAITRGNVKEQKIQAAEALGKLWQKQKYPGIAAHYFAESGKLENSQKKLNFAAHLYTEALHDEKNPNVKQLFAQEAIGCYQHLLSNFSDNDTVRLDLAAMYINGSGETMKGIEQLLSIVRKDSTNIPANMVLGKMAIESGQLDKAIQRGNTILSVDKENVEAIMFLAEAHKRKGDPQKAKELLGKAKDIMNNPDFAKDVDAYMKTF